MNGGHLDEESKVKTTMALQRKRRTEAEARLPSFD
jgi:hypothetical protein